MNVQKLLRTSLFSVLALLLVGGLATAQAQFDDTPGQGEVYVFNSNGDQVQTSGGSDDFGSIQAGIDELKGSNATSADENGTVLVGQGDFEEDILVEEFGPTVTASSDDPSSTTINGTVEFVGDVGGAELSGFTVSSAPSNRLIYLRGSGTDSGPTSTVTISDNVLDANDAEAFVVELTTTGDGGEVELTGNEIRDGLTGVLVAYKSDVTIEGNTITGMSGGTSFPEGAGVKLNVAASDIALDIKGNNITGNKRGIILEDNSSAGNGSGAPTVTIEENNIAGNSEAGLEVNKNLTASGIDASDNWWGSAGGPVDEVTVATDGNVDGSSNRGAGDIVRLYEEGTDGGNTVTRVAGSGTAFSFVPFVGSGSLSNAGADGDLSSITIEGSDRSGFDTEITVNRGASSTSGTIGDASDPFENLNDAIGAALPGETIVVEGRGSGRYVGGSETVSSSDESTGSTNTITFTLDSDIGLSSGDVVFITGNGASALNNEAFEVLSTSGSDFTITSPDQTSSLSGLDGNGTVSAQVGVSGLGGDDNRVSIADDADFSSTVTFSAAADLSSNVDVTGIDFNQEFDTETDGNGDVTIAVERQGSAFFNSVSAIDILGGEVDIASAGNLVVEGGNTVTRDVDATSGSGDDEAALSRITTGSLEFDGDVTLAYELGTSSVDVETTGELPADGSVNQLQIGSSASGARLEATQDVSATDFRLGDGDSATGGNSNAANATFTGDLTVEDQANVLNGSSGDINVTGDLSVAGTFTITGQNDVLVLGNDATFNGAILAANGGPGAGDVVISNLDAETSDGTTIGSGDPAIAAGEGEFSANDVTFGLDDGAASDASKQFFDIAIQAGDNSNLDESGDEITIGGTVDVNLKDDAGTGTDSIDVVLEDLDGAASDASEFVIGGGDDFGELTNPSNSGAYEGLVAFTGDATFTDDGPKTGNQNAGAADLDLNGNGTLAVASGATLTVRNEGSGNTIRQSLGNGGSVEGFSDGSPSTDAADAGTVAFEGTGQTGADPVHEVFTSSSQGTYTPSVTALRPVNFGDGSDNHGFDLAGLDAQAEVNFNTSAEGDDGEENEIGALNAAAPVSFSAGGNSISTLTADAQVTFTDEGGSGTENENTVEGSLNVENTGEIQSGTNGLSVEGQAIVDGGNLVLGGDFAANLSLDISGDATINSDDRVEVGSDLSAGGNATYSLESATLAFTQDGIGSEIDLGTDLTVGGLEIDKLAETATLTEGSSLVVSGNVNVFNAGPSPDSPLRLEDDLQVGGNFDLKTNTQAGNNVNAVSGPGSVVFANAGKLQSTSEGEATIQSVEVASSAGGDVAVEDSLKFGVATLNGNGFDLSTADADLSPVSDTAEVVANGASITAGSGTFNAEGGDFDLTLGTTDGSPFDTGTALFNREAGDDFGLQDFTVSGGGTANLDGTAIPRGDVLVESGATLAGGGVLNLTDAASNNLNGTVEVDIESAGERTVDGGENGVVANVTATGPDADVTVIAQEVTGEVSAVDTSSVTLDLEGNDGTVGSISVNRGGQVDLDSRTIVTGNVDISGSADGDGNPNSSASVLSLGENDLVVQGDLNQNLPGAVADSAEYNSSGGAIVLDTDGDVGSSGQVIPNITVADADESGNTPSPSIPSDDTLAFDGQVTLESSFGNNTSGDGNDGLLLATGSTVTLDAGDGAEVNVPEFSVNSSSTTTIEDGSGEDEAANTLVVNDSLRFETGELDHGVDVQAEGVLDFTPTGDVSVTATAGQLELDGADVLLGADLPVPALGVVGGPGNGSDLVANEAGDEFDILVGRSLELGSALSTTADNTGSLVLTSGNDVELTRLNDYPDGDVLDEAPSFEGSETTYDLVYTGDAGNSVTSGFEAVGESNRIDSLTVNFDASGTELKLDSDESRIEGTVTVNTALQALSGDVDYGGSDDRDLAVADGSEVLRTNDGDFTGVDSNSDPIQIEGDNYTVAYRSTSTSSALTQGVEEFPEGRSLALRVQAGVENPDGTADAGDFDLTGSRSVDSLDVSTAGDSEIRVARALDVSGSADLSGPGTIVTDGDVGTTGNQPAQDSLTIAGSANVGGGNVNGADIEGNLAAEGGTANNVDVAGDVTIEAGGSLGSAVRLDGEGVQGLTLGDNVDQADVTSLTVDQSATADTETPRVELSGGDLNVTGDSDGNGLTLNGGLIVAQNDELIDLNDAGFDRNVEDGETSHIVGSVRQTVAPGGTGDQVRANFPVGTEAGSFRSYELIFPNGLAETELTVDHVTTDPGTEGLPVEDETGVTVQSTPGYRWEVTSDQNVGLGQSYEVSLQADSLDFSEVPADNFRLVRRGNVEGSAFNLIGTGENYSNFRTQQDGEAQIRTSSATEDITTAGVIFTVGQPTAETAEGLQIAGQVNYPTVSDGNVVDGRALEGVEVEATSGDVTATATTDADGNFTIGGLDSGDYEVTANVDRDVSNVSIGDAQRTVSGFAGTEPFAGAFQEEVADVNASGTANATDALRIAFFDLGSISSFEAGSFLVDTTEVTLGSESESGVTVRVAEFGDADLSGGSSDSGGDASLATTTVSPKSSAQTAAKSATESAGDANRVAAGETFEVPVRVDRGAEVGSYSLSLEYDTEKATFEGISSGRDDIITNGSKEDGTLQVGWFDRSGESTLELTGGSELVTLRFSAAEGVEGAEFAPEITSGEINGPGAKAVAAGVETQAVRIAKPAPDEFALNGSYPNPASQQATVEMDLPVRAQVTVEVYNTLGQRVQTVEQSMSAGAGQTVQLDASQLASGQYFYRVKASLDGNQTRETGRLTIVK